MNHRALGRTGLSVSEIGLGTEFLLGLPQVEAVGVIRAALDAGTNYVDMFWAQPEFRGIMGVAFRGRRDEVFITAHLGSTLREGQYAVSRDPGVCAEFFHDDLTRLKTDAVDVLFVHNCNSSEDADAALDDGGLVALAETFVEDGKARFVGWSGHNTVTARRAVESGRIDVLMFPVNLASYAVPGKADLLRACAEHDVGLVAMKVFGGGSLLRDKRVVELQDFQMGRQQMPGAPSHYELTTEITPVKCLAYVLDQPQISTTVPGCKSVEELEDALSVYEANAEEKDYALILPAFAQFATGECVYCNHCLPCPSTIDIGATISLLEQGKQTLTADLRTAYTDLDPNASDCIACEQCTSRCPFGVDVVSKMREAAALFA